MARPEVWYHVAAVKKGDTIALFVDGQLEATTALGRYRDVPFPAELRIGAGRNGEYLRGLVDEVTIYMRALSAEEIQRIYQTGVG